MNASIISSHTLLATSFAATLVALIAGCSTPLQTKVANRPFYAEPERRVPAASGAIPEIITPSYGKVIAVTDIAYKQEFRDFFYDEKASSKSESIEFPAPPKPVPPPAAQDPIRPAPESFGPESALPQHIPDPSPMRNQSSLDRRAYLQSAVFRKVQLTPDDLRPMPPSTPDVARIEPVPPSTLADNTAPKGSRSESTYSKRFGFEQKVAYGELRGISADIRALLIKSGYTVSAARPAVSTSVTNDQYFDILERIKSGHFSGADYVLYGVLSALSVSDHNEPIVGTRNAMQFHVLDITVDFSLIDTRNSQVVASFTAIGSGRDQRIDGQATNYKPSQARLLRQASASMAEDVAINLNSQHLALPGSVIPTPAKRGSSGGEKFRNDEAATSLRVYR
jgi:hypothetical protein